MTTPCAPHAFKTSTSSRSSKSRPSALQSHLKTYIQMCVDHSPRPPWLAIATISYSSMTTHNTPPFGSFQTSNQKHALQPTNQCRPELTSWDMKYNDFGAIIMLENMKTRPLSWSSLLMVQHTNHALPMLTLRMELRNEWSRSSPRKHDLWWLTPGHHLIFGERQSTPRSTSISDYRMKA